MPRMATLPFYRHHDGGDSSQRRTSALSGKRSQQCLLDLVAEVWLRECWRRSVIVANSYVEDRGVAVLGVASGDVADLGDGASLMDTHPEES